ncbi:MAG: M28 family metallopeptidase [Terriglobia bacterium]
MEYTRAVAEEFPDRVTGTAAAHRAANYLFAQFQKLGYQVSRPTFPIWLRGERVQGENVIAWLEGGSPESVAVIAHYDSQFTSHEAAEDNASGVGVLLELAAVLRDGPHPRDLIFAATDAEEWGMIGARELVGFLKERRTVAVISIDYLTAGPATGIEMSCQGQFAGYSPLWLRQLLVASGRAHNVQFEQTTGVPEWIERAMEISPQDQGPLLRAGIPAVNLGTDSPDVEAVRARYHSTADVFRNFEPTTFQMVGSTVEQAVLTLGAIPAIPSKVPSFDTSDSLRTSALMTPVRGGRADDFQISTSRYLPAALVYVIQVLLLLPILIAAYYAAYNFAVEDLDLRGWRFFEPVCWIIPPGLATLLLYRLTQANVLPRYELYPATPKDPFLYHLPIGLVATLVAVMVVGSAALQRLRARVDAPPARFAEQKRILFLWIAFVAVVGFLNNPYAVWLLLGALTYAAGLLLPPRGAPQRIVNAALLIAAAAPFAALVYSFGREIYLGWRIGWYLVLQAAYGVWSPAAVALLLLAAVLWVQLLWTSVLTRHPGTAT